MTEKPRGWYNIGELMASIWVFFGLWYYIDITPSFYFAFATFISLHLLVGAIRENND